MSEGRVSLKEITYVQCFKLAPFIGEEISLSDLEWLEISTVWT